MDEERTHRITVELSDNTGVIDLFVTITGITPLPEGLIDSETASNQSFDVIPSKLTREDIENYVCRNRISISFNTKNVFRVLFQLYD